ncbi:MAG: metal-sensitive transcriptional regulator [Anaerolineae bacterium]|jgi:DNA-binding FrmR family transcriptional regulator|uniref:metal-sensitive transcriptional regulator n=1 Tax=Candidatus Amarolinea dominans TaxID=3140696 RepID=UPI001D2D4542|nr:metal-sensitive transcriptional regulator [Anaerolineae bacterium]MBK7199575.1 metal-sensitive transcriptional regulator [Anaerolineae bacterium]MBK9095510.1 metal-sensitive transcriptional regulator [Anaerolineae bacterium]MBK9231801.1 metal-sensitive transcriptional regulator [Anaerolineae bacterium]
MNAQTKEQVLSRLKSIEGHVRGIQRMVTDDNYCIDVISQVQAVQKALDRVNSLLLDNHLNSCVITAVRSDDSQERERVLGELLHVFETGSKL